MRGAALKSAWSQIQNAVKARVGERPYKNFLENTHLVTLTEELLELGVANRFFADIIGGKYETQLIEAVAEVTGHRPRLKLSISGALFREAREKQAAVLAELEAERHAR